LCLLTTPYSKFYQNWITELCSPHVADNSVAPGAISQKLTEVYPRDTELLKLLVSTGSPQLFHLPN
jgi:hypothetical protein